MATPASALHPPRSPEETTLAESFAKFPADESRRSAFEAFAKEGLPHRRMEGWRWSDVRNALKQAPAEKDARGTFADDIFRPLGGPEITFGDIGATHPKTDD